MSRKAPNNKVDVVLGAQWGDEGKGKLVDMLSVDMDITARCAGGNNAGHTVLCNGIKVWIWFWNFGYFMVFVVRFPSFTKWYHSWKVKSCYGTWYGHSSPWSIFWNWSKCQKRSCRMGKETSHFWPCSFGHGLSSGKLKVKSVHYKYFKNNRHSTLDTKQIVLKAVELQSEQPKRVLVQHMQTRLQELVSELPILYIISTLVPFSFFYIICAYIIFDIYLATWTGNVNGVLTGVSGVQIFFS